MKIVINRCYGGFQLSDEAMEHLGLQLTFAREIANGRSFYHDGNMVSNKDFGITSPNRLAYRIDPRLIAAVEALGNAASGKHAALRIIEIPDDVDWYIDEQDGMELVAEHRRTWR